ncbi:MAG: hypothetical protein WD605_01080 [Candidatus Paceibacterota bacterium]
MIRREVCDVGEGASGVEIADADVEPEVNDTETADTEVVEDVVVEDGDAEIVDETVQD